MNLKLVRRTLTEQSTIGTLSINGIFECFTLEDRVRPVKIHGATAIPAGIYEVAITFSDRFQKPLPLLLNVPNFAGIRIHPGNTAADTEGCILVGTTERKDFVGSSRVAFRALFTKLDAALRREKVFIEVGGVAGVPAFTAAPVSASLVAGPVP
jgi:hypothetical protein